MSVLIVLPVIDPARSAQCFASLDESVLSSLIVVDNSHRRVTVPDGVHVTMRPFANLGVARSWNAATRYARYAGARAVVFVSAQVKFGAGGGRDLLELAERVTAPTAPGPTYWHNVIFPIAALDVLGEFDENFYPAYYEDADMQRRCALEGIEIDDAPTIDAIETGPGHGVEVLRLAHPGVPTVNYEQLAAYWQAKWGCDVNDCTDRTIGFLTPFDGPHRLSWWERASIDELLVRYQIVGS